MLVIKWEPRDVYLACAFEDTRGHVQTTAVMFDHNVGVICSIESLISTKLITFHNIIIEEVRPIEIYVSMCFTFNQHTKYWTLTF